MVDRGCSISINMVPVKEAGKKMLTRDCSFAQEFNHGCSLSSCRGSENFGRKHLEALKLGVEVVDEAGGGIQGPTGDVYYDALLLWLKERDLVVAVEALKCSLDFGRAGERALLKGRGRL